MKKFNTSNILYYIGGFIILFAYSFWLGTSWESLTHFQRILITLVTIIVLGSFGTYLKFKTEFTGAGKLLVFAASGVIPLLIYSIEKASGIWPDFKYGSITYESYLRFINQAWLYLDIITVVLLIIIFYIFKDPILTLLVSNFAAFLVQDGTAYIFGYERYSAPYWWMWFLGGVLILAWSLYFHFKEKSEFALWPSIYGLLLILASNTALIYEAKPRLAFELMLLFLSVVMILSSIPLKSKTYLTFGSIGLFWFIGDISYKYFYSSLGFTFTLTIVGLIIIAIGIFFQKYKYDIFTFLKKEGNK